MSDPVINTYYDQFPNHLINNTTGSTTVNVTTPAFYRNNHYTIEVQIYNQYPATQDLSPYSDWHLGIGNIGGGALIECTDVTTTSAATGKLIFNNVNTHSVAFVADLGSTPMKQYYMELNATDGVNYNTIALNPIYGKATVL
jgi:hypothetical protein